MRTLIAALLLLAGPALGQPAVPAPLTADTPTTTVVGNTFIAPAGWTVSVRGPATILEPPEGDSWIALVDVEGEGRRRGDRGGVGGVQAGREVAAQGHERRARQGRLVEAQAYEYQTSPNEKRGVQALAAFANGRWTVVVVDMARCGRREARRAGRPDLRPAAAEGLQRASRSRARSANTLDSGAHRATLTEFVETGQKELGVPGVSLGIVQDGKVVFAGGFGVRELGKPAKVDGDTLFMIASNTKALTTLLLAKLVDEKQAHVGHAGDDAAAVVQARRRRDDEAGARAAPDLRVHRHAAPGPRVAVRVQGRHAGERARRRSATMQPTSKFGELFQYSNLMAAAGGLHRRARRCIPKMELGAAYDKAMQTRVFEPARHEVDDVRLQARA